MKVAGALCLLCMACSTAVAFVPSGTPLLQQQHRSSPVQQHQLSRTISPVRMQTEENAEASSTPKTSSIVQASPENVEFSAGVVGALAGFVVAGPWGAVLLSAITNYGSKQQNDVGDAVRGLSKSAIEVFNFLSNVNAKYDVTDKAAAALGEAVSKIKEGDETQNLAKVEEVLRETKAKATKLAADYDLVAKGKQALGVVGELTDTAIEKTVELEKEYKVVDKVKESVKSAVDKSSQ